MNELLLLLSVPLLFGGLLLSFVILKKDGLYLWTVVASIASNIEVLILVRAFGMEMTLGNVLFASTFLVTDFLSEIYGKKESRHAVLLGFASTVIFLGISQYWLLYKPCQNDFATPSVHTIFSNTPRLMLASILVYAICQMFDVWMYHKVWDRTRKKSGSADRFLWLRNNASTMVSQLINAVLYTLAAFWGKYPTKTLVSIMVSSFIIFIITSLLDTPFLYVGRNYAQKKHLGKYAEMPSETIQ